MKWKLIKSKGLKIGVIVGILTALIWLAVLFFVPVANQSHPIIKAFSVVSFPLILSILIVTPVMRLFCGKEMCLGLIEPAIFISAIVSIMLYGILGILIEKLVIYLKGRKR